MFSAAPRLPIHSPNSPDHATTISTSKEANYRFATSYIFALIATLTHRLYVLFYDLWRVLTMVYVTLALKTTENKQIQPLVTSGAVGINYFRIHAQSSTADFGSRDRPQPIRCSKK